MKRMTRRKIIDAIVTGLTFFVLYKAGAGAWSMVVVPFGLWNYYDGYSRHEMF